MGSSDSKSARQHHQPSGQSPSRTQSQSRYLSLDMGDGRDGGRGRRGTEVLPSSHGHRPLNEEKWSDVRSNYEEGGSWNIPNLESPDVAKLRMSVRRDLDLKSQSTKTLPNPELKDAWRQFDWGKKKELLNRLEMFSTNNPNVKNIRILVAGQVGAGKSSFINSVNSAFQGEIACDALANATSAKSYSFTERLESYRIRSADKALPFEICDVMGLEPETLSGCHADDIISSIYGHVKDGYQFKTRNPLSHEDEYYKESPSLSDQAFCLVYVIDACTVQFTDERLIEKIKLIRKRISEAGIPQVIVMTKVDEACPLVSNDLRKIYKSKKIKEKMEMCSGKIGVPMNCIFPVKNYSDEIDTEDDVDVLILKAFDQIVRSANSRLMRDSEVSGTKQYGTLSRNSEISVSKRYATLSRNSDISVSKRYGTPSKKLDNPWRTFDWGQKDKLKDHLEHFQLSNPNLTHIKILLAGQIGAGKSSFINSVNSAFQGEIACNAQANASQTAASRSFTKKLKAHRIRSGNTDLPFEIWDVMGLDPEELTGLQPEDVLKIIHGHVKDGYTFTENSITSESESYNEMSSLQDQVFCLVYIVDANTIQLSSDEMLLFKKLRLIREKTSEQGIPQVVVLTKVDEACPLVSKDLKNVYYSKKIKEKMELCSGEIGLPLSNIFPVKNYHDEVDTNDDADVMILKAFDQIVRLANMRLRDV